MADQTYNFSGIADVPKVRPPMAADELLLHEFRGTMPPASERETPHMAAPTGREPVTFGELAEDPIGAIKRIAVHVGKDATDPRMWLSVAASYFGPKIFNKAAPIVARAAASVKAIDPADAIGMVSPRMGNAARVARAVRQPPAVAPAATAGAPVPVAAPPAAPLPTPAGAAGSPPPTPAAAVPNQAPVATTPAAMTPLEATRANRAQWQAAQPPMIGQSLATLAKEKLSAAEVAQGLKWLKQGKSPEQIMTLIEQSRALTAKLGTPTPQQAADALRVRNDTGKW